MTPAQRLAPEMRAVIARQLAEDGPQPDPTLLSPAEGRALAEAGNRRWNAHRPAMARDLIAQTPAGRVANVFIPKGEDGKRAILYVHGGGWAFCSAATHESAARELAVQTRAAVVTFDYRLAPEHPYPAGLQDCRDIWAERDAILPGRVWSLAGDSAGANLAVALSFGLTTQADRPQSLLLFYGVFDADFGSPSYVEVADGPGLTRDKMRRYWDLYAPESNRDGDPCLIPARAPDEMLAALPPLYLNAAEVDPLRSDSERLSARLRGLGRDDAFDTVPGVIHGFMQMSLWLPQARSAFARAGEVFRAIT